MRANGGDMVFAACGATWWIEKEEYHQLRTNEYVDLKCIVSYIYIMNTWLLLYRLTWLLNCGLAPAPAAGHPPAAGPIWRGAPVLEGVTECVMPFWRDIWASICPAEWPGCAIWGVICGAMLTGLLNTMKPVTCHLHSKAPFVHSTLKCTRNSLHTKHLV